MNDIESHFAELSKYYPSDAIMFDSDPANVLASSLDLCTGDYFDDLASLSPSSSSSSSEHSDLSDLSNQSSCFSSFDDELRDMIAKTNMQLPPPELFVVLKELERLKELEKVDLNWEPEELAYLDREVKKNPNNEIKRKKRKKENKDTDIAKLSDTCSSLEQLFPNDKECPNDIEEIERLVLEKDAKTEDEAKQSSVETEICQMEKLLETTNKKEKEKEKEELTAKENKEKEEANRNEKETEIIQIKQEEEPLIQELGEHCIDTFCHEFDQEWGHILKRRRLAPEMNIKQLGLYYAQGGLALCDLTAYYQDELSSSPDFESHTIPLVEHLIPSDPVSFSEHSKVPPFPSFLIKEERGTKRKFELKIKNYELEPVISSQIQTVVKLAFNEKHSVRIIYDRRKRNTENQKPRILVHACDLLSPIVSTTNVARWLPKHSEPKDRMKINVISKHVSVKGMRSFVLRRGGVKRVLPYLKKDQPYFSWCSNTLLPCLKDIEQKYSN